jgi:hypothetical protein
VVVATVLNEFIVNIVFQITAFRFPQHHLVNLLGAREQIHRTPQNALLFPTGLE